MEKFPSADYEAIFSITRHQPGGFCTKILHVFVIFLHIIVCTQYCFGEEVDVWDKQL